MLSGIAIVTCAAACDACVACAATDPVVMLASTTAIKSDFMRPSSCYGTELLDRARELGQLSRPFVVVARFARAEVDAERAELCGARGLRRVLVDVDALGDRELDEARRDNRRLKLCFQQSTRDSALPEVDVPLALFGHCLLHQDVAHLNASARLQNARNLLKSCELVGEEIHDAIRDDDVRPSIFYWKHFAEPLAKIDVSDGCLLRSRARLCDHLWRHVYADDSTSRTYHGRRDQTVDAGAAPDVDDVLTGVQAAHRERISGSGERGNRRLGNSVEPFFLVLEDAREPATGVKVKTALRLGRYERVLLADRVSQPADVETFD